MVRRISIRRLMLAIGLTALGLTLFREWLGPRNFLGPLGPLAILVLLGVVAMLVTADRAWRFFAGMTATASALVVAILIAPATSLGATFDFIVVPVDRWLEPSPPSGPGFSRLELMALWSELGGNHFGQRPSIRSFDDWVARRLTPYDSFSTSTELQSWLMIPHAALAAIGGLLATVRRPRPRQGDIALQATAAEIPSQPSTFPSLSD
jgi:hypothetical protein